MRTGQTSVYCWTILAVFIIATVAFMVNFYNRALKDITDNATLIVRQELVTRN